MYLYVSPKRNYDSPIGFQCEIPEIENILGPYAQTDMQTIVQIIVRAQSLRGSSYIFTCVVFHQFYKKKDENTDSKYDGFC